MGVGRGMTHEQYLDEPEWIVEGLLLVHRAFINGQAKREARTSSKR